MSLTGPHRPWRRCNDMSVLPATRAAFSEPLNSPRIDSTSPGSGDGFHCGLRARARQPCAIAMKQPMKAPPIQRSQPGHPPSLRPSPEGADSHRPAVTLVQGGEHLVRGEGQVAQPDPNRVVHCVGHRGRHRIDGQLPDALGVVGPSRLGTLHQHRPHIGNVGCPRQRIVEHGRVDRPAALVDELLSQYRAQGHDHASDDLSLDGAGVDGPADVVGGHVVHDADAAGRLVDLYLSTVGAERVAG